jgi:transposase-like protein
MTKRQDRDAIYAKRRFDTEIIVLCVRWYITYRLSYRDLVAMMAERGVIVSHRTIMRWVIRFVPVLRVTCFALRRGQENDRMHQGARRASGP